MAKKHYIMILTGIVVCCVVLFAFFYSESRKLGVASEPDRKYEIHVILKALNNPPDFWRVVEQGVNAAALEYDVECSVSAPAMEKDVDKQMELLQAAIDARPDAILLAASDYERLSPLCRKAVDAGILLVTLDSDVSDPGRRCFIGTDNVLMGTKLAGLVEELTEPTEIIGIIGHVQGTSTAVEREKGLVEGLENSDTRIRAIAYCDGSEALARNLTLEMLEKNPDITCMVGLNESSALGVANAVAEQGLGGRVKVIACDSSQKQIEYMEQGIMQAFVIQHPFTMGYVGLQTTVRLLRGETVPALVHTDSVVIRKEDLYRPENQKLLFPFTE